MRMQEYKKVVKRNIEAVKGKIRKRRFIIAIDEAHEPFYGKIKNLWITIIHMVSKVLPAHTNTSLYLLYPMI
jgi:hypothetical protein